MNLCQGNYLTTQGLVMDFRYNTSNIKPELIDVKSSRQLKLKEIVEKCEREVIFNVLKESKSYRKAAKVLDISHTTIINKVKKYNL